MPKKGKSRGSHKDVDTDTTDSALEVTVRESVVASTPLLLSDLGYGTMPETSLWTTEVNGSSVVASGVQTRAQKLHQTLNPIKRLVIRRTEPGSPILVSAIGSDLDVTVFHEEAGRLGLHVSVENVENRESESEATDEPFFDSFFQSCSNGCSCWTR